MLEAGTRLGHYEILSTLGAGGMGEVYRAKDTKLGREVAIKLLLEEVSADPERMARFEREARVLASLNHPNIASLHAFEQEGETSFLVMEYLVGETLEDRIGRGRISIEEALRIGSEIAEGMGAAHRHGVVHRDLKPANVMLTKTGTKVLDFGLARSMGPTGAALEPEAATMSAALTEEGRIVGTMPYMAPEQLQGGQIDARTDIWALGCILYEMTTGHRPFGGDSRADLIASILGAEPAPPSRLQPLTPPRVDWVVERCLQKDAGRRWHSAKDVAIELESVADRPSDEPRDGLSQPRRWIWALPVVAAVIAGIAVWWLKPESNPESGNLSGRGESSHWTITLPPRQEVVDMPAITRDGRTLAYAARDQDGRVGLYVRSLDDFEARLLTDQVDLEIFPFFSFDGEWLAYFAKGSLMKIHVGGGAPTVLAAAADPVGGTWLNDDTIIFAPEHGGLHRVTSSGGSLEQLTFLDPSDYAHAWPQALPGGRHVLFQVWGRVGTALLSLDTGEWERIVEEKTAQYVPSGHLLGVNHQGEARAGVYDPEGDKVGSMETIVLSDVLGHYGKNRPWLAFSESGTLVYVPGTVASRKLVWVDRRGTSTAIPSQLDSYELVKISPDGGRLAVSGNFVQRVFDPARDVWTYLEVPGSQCCLVWTRDSRKLIFSSNHEGDWDLYRSAPDGSGLKRILERGGVVRPQSVSPTGSVSFGADGDIFVLEPDGKVVEFVTSSADDKGSAFSPDGRFVAYDSDRSGSREIYLAPYPGPGEKTSVGGGKDPRWSADGRELFFLRDDGTLMVVPVDTSDGLSLGRSTPLLQTDMEGILAFDVAPDGTRFAAVVGDPDLVPDKIHVVQNWFGELERLVPTD